MDTLFALGQESRLRILHKAAARIPGCAYLCAWAALPAAAAAAQQPLPPAYHSSSSSSPAPAATTSSARLLCCLDAWLCCDGAGPRGDAAAAAGRLRALFDAYRGSLCAAVRGCVPGWAFKDGRAYMELPAHDLTASASLPAQQQFYQEAGIKMAAFMGCESGEIEVGVSTAASGSSSSPMSGLESTLQQVFSEEFFQQSLLEELLQLPPTGPSSPSSSLPSASVDSPAAAEVSTSLLRAVAVTTTPPPSAAAAPAPSWGERRHAPMPVPVVHPPPIHHQAARPPLPVAFDRRGHVHHFPSAEADDAAMAQAMLAVISSAATSSSSSALPATPSAATPPPAPPPARRWPRRRGTTAFRAYNAALAPRGAPTRRPPGAPGQRMIKMGISILRRMHMLRFGRERTAGAAMAQQGPDDEAEPPPAPSSSQLNHMISERRRRERLNESFEALRALLPPGSKNDKASVLAKTLEYMQILVAQIADLEARNRSLELEARAHHPHLANGGGSKQWAPPLPYSWSEQHPALAAFEGLISGGGASSEERVQVDVTTTTAGGDGASTSSSAPSPWPRGDDEAVTVRVAVRAAAVDVAELVPRVLAAIREMARFTVVAVDARRGAAAAGGGDAQATFTLRAAAGGLDEASLKEAVTRAAQDSATPP